MRIHLYTCMILVFYCELYACTVFNATPSLRLHTSTSLHLYASTPLRLYASTPLHLYTSIPRGIEV